METSKKVYVDEPLSSQASVGVSSFDSLTEEEKKAFHKMVEYFNINGVTAPTKLIIQKIVSERDQN
jgi:hypothetical protein